MRLRLASYNIRKAVGLDWRRDPSRTLGVIRALDADVVALQEADKRLGLRPAALPPDAIERETGLRAVPLGHSPVSLGWHGNAVLVRKSLKVSDAICLDLPGIEPRGCVIVRLATDAGELTVVAVHLGLRRRCRRLQFARILDALDAAEPARTVILGDFNEWSAYRGVEPLLPDFRVVRPGNSFHASQPVAPLDRFALGARVALIGSGVEGGPAARRASDHLPVWSEVELR